MRCLVTGATGYVGGRLVPQLLAAGHRVRCLTRSERRLRGVPWAERVEVVEGDVTAGTGLAAALRDVDLAYYLVHSIGQPRFEELDRAGADSFSQAAAEAHLRRLIYLGGPEPPASPTQPARTSAHLRSRDDVARILLAGPTPTTVLRAAVIIGSGSASFEMLRYLTERLPIMVAPRWVNNRIEPIAIRDVLRYLVACADPAVFPADLNRGFDIGGGEVFTYRQMMTRYATVAELKPRIIIPVRPLTPALSAGWVGFVTPVPNAIARPLVESLIHEAVTREHDIAEFIPDPPDGRTDFDTSVRLALRRTKDAEVQTRWSDAAWPGAPNEPLPADPLPTDPSWSGGTVYTDVREYDVAAPAERLWRVVEAIGGEQGWYSFPLAWSVRGWLDRLVGGVGLRRGRRHPRRLRVGDALDFWRVEEIVPGSLLRLRAEMRLPGRAWLELRVTPGETTSDGTAHDGTAHDGTGHDGTGHAHYTQRAIFLPRGLPGHAYWQALAPFHTVIFGGMARDITRTAERGEPGHGGDRVRSAKPRGSPARPAPRPGPDAGTQSRDR